MKTLPKGPVQTVLDWYAVGRLAWTTFGMRTWGEDLETHWWFLLSRVVEHSAKYLIACVQRVLQDTHQPDSLTDMHLWSDGAAQMKNGLLLGHSIQILERRPNILRVTNSFGCSKHFKGPWDGQFGTVSAVIEDHCKTHACTEISELVQLLTAWADRRKQMHPSGPTYHFIEFMPQQKNTYEWVQLDSKTLKGLRRSQCFSFTRADRRRRSLWGKGMDLWRATGVHFKNHILTGLRAEATNSGHASRCAREESDSEAESEAADDDILITSREFNGWKCSYRTETEAAKRHQRRVHLQRQFQANSCTAAKLPEAWRHRTVAELKARAERIRAKQMASRREAKAAANPPPFP